MSQPVSEHYSELTGSVSELVTDASSAESVDASATLANRSKPTHGCVTVAVNTEFSTAAATVVVYCILRDKDGTLLGVQQATATAGAQRTAAAGDYIGGTLAFDTFGAPLYEIRHAAVSAGTVDISAWVCGAKSQ